MNEINRPMFTTWRVDNLISIANDLYDQNIELREQNESLRLKLKDAEKTINELQNKDDWK